MSDGGHDGADGDWFSLAELATRIGQLIWVEEHLADLLASWSTNDVHHRAAELFAATSGHHAWHAQVLRDQLPTSPQLVEASAVAPPTVGWSDTIATLADLTGEQTALRLTVWLELLDPWIEREVEALVTCTPPVSEAALHRWLRFCTIDHVDDTTIAAALATQLRSNTTSLTDRSFLLALNLQ